MKQIISGEQFNKTYKQVENTKSTIETVVVALIYVENKINLYLEKKLPRPEDLWQDNRYLSYDIKLKLALSLGFINDRGMWGDFVPHFKQINQLRNKFAHKIDYKLDGKDKKFLDEVNKFFQNSHPEDYTFEKMGELEYTKRAMTILMSFAGLFANV